MRLGALTRITEPERRQAATAGVEVILDEAVAASRSLAVELSPPILQAGGLIGALAWLGARVEAQNGMRVVLHTDPAAEPATQDIRLLLFECVRELLLNAAKHADAPEVEVTLTGHPDGGIRVVVGDAGKGFDPQAVRRRPPDEASLGLSLHDDPAVADAMGAAGAVAYLTKDVAPEALIGSIRACHEGRGVGQAGGPAPAG